jgi:pyruvyl transferase EpsI
MKVHITDTMLNRVIKAGSRISEIRTKCSEIAGAKIFITDRLHGMIFAALTGTPCIIFHNYNQKIKGVYEWIRELPYIRLINDVSELESNLEQLINNKCKFKFSEELLEKYYEPLYEALKT